MKKKVVAIIIMSMSIGLIGCGKQESQKKEDVSNNSSTEQVQPKTTEESSNELSVDEAKEIALKDANLTGDQVEFIRTELDYEHGVKAYEIDFYYENKEYDYEIGVTDGQIISSNVEAEEIHAQQYQQQPQQQSQASQNGNNEITVEKAKEIALKDANLTSDQVKFIRTEIEVDHGVRKYEVDFNLNNKEYDYEIDATTGSIISYEVD